MQHAGRAFHLQTDAAMKYLTDARSHINKMQTFSRKRKHISVYSALIYRPKLKYFKLFTLPLINFPFNLDFAAIDCARS